MAQDESIAVASLEAQLTAEKRRGVAAEQQARPARQKHRFSFGALVRFAVGAPRAPIRRS